MRFSVEWLAEATRGMMPEERASSANFRVWIGDRNACLHLDGNTSVDELTMPLYSLAEGLAHDWWSLFGARDGVFSLVRHRMGYAVPDIRMSFDGVAFEIESPEKSYRNPNVRFLTAPPEAIDRITAESELAGFIDGVVGRLEAEGIHETGCALRWRRVQNSRADPEESVFCEAAGALGLDPYQIAGDWAQLIDLAITLFDREAVTEFLSGVKGHDAARALEWVGYTEKRPRHRSRLPGLEAMSGTSTATSGLTPSEDLPRTFALGYRRARQARTILDMTERDRLKSVRAITGRLGNPRFEPARSVDGLRALRTDIGLERHIHLRAHGGSNAGRTAGLFALARAIGDVACFPSSPRFVINDARLAARQAAGRAFAAEFLAPVTEILSMVQDGRDIPTIADEFAVSTTVIERQLENVERIEMACA